MRRRKTAHFDVVPHHVVRAGKLRDFALEVLLLRVPARTPRQHAADVQVFADDLPHHVGRGHAFGGAVVVGAAGGVHVMVARVPMLVRRVHPTGQLKFGRLRRLVRLHVQRLVLDQVFRSAGVFDFVVARRKQQRLAIGPINLVVEEEIGRQTPCPVRIDAIQFVAHDERCRRRLAVEILDAQDDLRGRQTVEQNRHAAAKAEVLRPLAHVKADIGLALARVPRVEHHDAVFDAKPRKGPPQGLLFVEIDVEKPLS